MAFQLKIPGNVQQPLVYDFPQGFAGGLNISVPADLIAPNESPDMLNMNYNTGAKPTKRFGFSRVNAESWGAGGIKGMTEYTPPGDTLMRIVAWDGKLWQLNDDGTKTDLMTDTKASIADTQCWFFVMGDKLYCMNGTDYVVYDGTNPVADVTGYVPLIVIGKEPAGTGGAPNEELNVLSDSWREGFTADGTAAEYVITIEADSIDEIEINGVTVDPADYTFPTGGDYAKVSFSTAPAADAEVIIQPTKDGLNDPTLITKCTRGIIYGGRNDTRLILAGNPDYPNWRFESYLTDPTYFPATSGYTLVGSDAEKLTCFGRMIDYLINFKYDKIFYSSIEVDTSGVSFPTYPMNDEYGCIAPRTVKPAQGGLLALSRDGVIWVKPSLVRAQLNVDMVSGKVNGIARNGVAPGILDESIADLENAHASLDHGKYRIHINDRTWVLDLNYSNLASGIYCWYVYDNVYTVAGQFLASDDDSFYVGHNSIGVVFKQERTDEEYQFVDDGGAIEGYWTSPALFGDRRDWIKKFQRLKITFKAGPCTNHVLTLISDEGEEDIEIPQESGQFNFNFFDFSCFTFGTQNTPFPKTEPQKIGYKGEYLMFRVTNNDYNRGLVILGLTLTYSSVKEVK